MGIILNKNLTSGYIYEKNSSDIYLHYTNMYNARKYYLRRKIDSRIENFLNNDDTNTIPVVYSKYFPESAHLYELESDQSIISAIMAFVIVVTIVFVIKNDIIKLLNK